jgi:hypothetical protein
MKFLLVLLYSTFSQLLFAQLQERNDTVAVYKAVLDSFSKEDIVIASTSGKVMYADIYGNYDEQRLKDNKEMAAQGRIMVMWVEPERYPKSVATVIRENGVAFDTIRHEEVVWTKPAELQNLIPSYKFLSNNEAPLGYSFFGNLFKQKRALRFSELLFVKRLNVAVMKVRVEKRSNKDEWVEMIVLRKEQNGWQILDRIKSSR